MEVIKKHNVLEMVIYAGVWLIIYLSPVVLDYYEVPVEEDVAMNWTSVLKDWIGISFFFIIFLINNFLLSPYLFFRKRYIAYTVSVVCLVGVLLYFYPFASKSGPRNERMMQKEFRVQEEEQMETRTPPFEEGRAPAPFEAERGHDGQPEMEKRVPPPGMHPDQPYERKGGMKNSFRFPFPVMIFFTRFLIAFLMVGFNVAIKLFFKSLRNEEMMKELERHNLQSELEYLKYQINPHFFMNTLNNIHALVDIDTEKARSTLVELSKMMRYVLYEANNKTILLYKEVQFLDNYVRLMKIRYTDKVDIQLVLPQNMPEVYIPPLLFISFIENAFKHGVTYQSDSFIRISLKVDGDRIIFRCINSNYGKSKDQHKGIGLDNIRKRLKLIFGQDYVLKGYLKAFYRRQIAGLRGDIALKRLRRWELSTDKELVIKIREQREQNGVRFLEMVYGFSDLDKEQVQAISTLIDAGIVYLVVLEENCPMYNGIDIQNDKGWEQIIRGIDTLIDLMIK